MKYTAMQLPGITLVALILLLIRQQFDLSAWLIAAVIAAWVIKDAALFPLVWQYYSPYPPPPLHRLEGRRGVVHEPLTPRAGTCASGTSYGAPKSRRGTRGSSAGRTCTCAACAG